MARALPTVLRHIDTILLLGEKPAEMLREFTDANELARSSRRETHSNLALRSFGAVVAGTPSLIHAETVEPGASALAQGRGGIVAGGSQRLRS